MKRTSGPRETTPLTSASTRLAAGFIALVGVSAGTIALQGGASLPVISVTVLGGLLAGSGLLGYLYWLGS